MDAAAAAAVTVFRSLVTRAHRLAKNSKPVLDADMLLDAAPTLFVSTRIFGDRGVSHTYCDVQSTAARR
jgi:hypothetical protein